jgi:phosphohistidine phosphatase
MKRLFIVRHAKSSWKYSVSDLNRPLKKRGIIDANLVSKHTSNLFSKPDMIMCSPSKRTKQTAKIFIENWGLKNIFCEIEPNLYDFEGCSFLKSIKKIKNETNTIMIFAHNFAVSEFVNTFGNSHINSFPTCGFVVIDFNIDYWEQLIKGNTVYSIFPKYLK